MASEFILWSRYRGFSRSVKAVVFDHILFPSVFVLAACLMLLSTARNAVAQGAPKGTYQQSCNRISVKGNRLSAYCRAIDGSETLSVLNNFNLCEGDIWNDNGSLTCKKSSAPLLKVRDTLYYLGSKSGPPAQGRAIKKFTTTTITMGEGQGCSANRCTFNFGFYIDRKPAKGLISPYGEILVMSGGAQKYTVGNTIPIKVGEYSKSVVFPVLLGVGEYTLKVAVNSKDAAPDANNTDNRFEVRVIVKP